MQAPSDQAPSEQAPSIKPQASSEQAPSSILLPRNITTNLLRNLRRNLRRDLRRTNHHISLRGSRSIRLRGRHNPSLRGSNIACLRRYTTQVSERATTSISEGATTQVSEGALSPVFEGDKTKVSERATIVAPEGDSTFDLTDEGDIKNSLGVEIERLKDGSFEMKQPSLIDRILKVIGIEDGDNPKSTPASKRLLSKDCEGPKRKNAWNYRQAIGILSYLTGSTRPEISMAVHQCARFTNDPRLSHERALQWIARYLLGRRDRGIIFTPDMTKGIEILQGVGTTRLIQTTQITHYREPVSCKETQSAFCQSIQKNKLQISSKSLLDESLFIYLRKKLNGW